MSLPLAYLGSFLKLQLNVYNIDYNHNDMLARLVLSSWAQVICLPPPPKVMGSEV